MRTIRKIKFYLETGFANASYIQITEYEDDVTEAEIEEDLELWKDEHIATAGKKWSKIYEIGGMIDNERNEKTKLDLKTVYDVGSPPFEKCPFCGYDSYYVKQSYSGTMEFYYKFDGSEADNEEMYGRAKHKYIGKFVYCARCENKLFRFKA